MSDAQSGETIPEPAFAPSKAFTDWEKAAQFWEGRYHQASRERGAVTQQLNELRRHYDAANNAMNRAQQRAHDAEQRLRVAREQGWREEWNGRERVIVAEVLVERDKPGSPWPVVTIDGLRLPWFFRSISVGDITADELATVTLVLEAGLVVQSNEQPIQEPDEIVRDRAESLIERSHRAAASLDAEPAGAPEAEAP